MGSILIAAMVAALMVFVAFRWWWVMDAISFSCAYCMRLHYGPMPSMASMLLRVWHWDSLYITKHEAYIKHRRERTGPYERWRVKAG